jgi:diguanylate cyclase (GGDEF)-like protein
MATFPWRSSPLERVIHWLDHHLAAWRPWQHLAGTGALLAGLAAVDLFSGPVLSMVLFYLVPVGIATWYVGRRAGYGLAVLSGAIWFGTVLLNHLSPAVATWNALIRFGFLAVFIAILGRLRRNVRQLEHLAYHDPLTDALNSRAFHAVLGAAQERARAAGWPLTLAYLDLDNFKQLNDTRGHAAGDALLVQLVAEMHRQLRATDYLGRMGGDEFAILLQNVDPAAARCVIARLEARVDQFLKSGGWEASLSVGVVTFAAIPERQDAMIQAADRLMYQAKQAGKHGVCYMVYTPEASGAASAAPPAST